jgi:hypothetical protein
MFKANNPLEWTIFFSKKQFHYQISNIPKENLNSDDQKRKKQLKFMKFIFTTHLSTFYSNIFLALKIMSFKNVVLTQIFLQM